MTRSFRWFVLFWLAIVCVFCTTKSLKPPSLPTISPENEDSDQTILFDWLVDPVENEHSVNMLEEDISMTIHLLGKRLCANYDGLSNGVAQPLSFPCKITKEKTKVLQFEKKEDGADENLTPDDIFEANQKKNENIRQSSTSQSEPNQSENKKYSPNPNHQTKLSIGTISANPLPSFKFLEVDLAKKAKTKGISMQVMDNIVDFFKTCPEDQNYNIFKDSEVQMIDTYLATTDDVTNNKIYKLSNKAKYFNYMRKPCCRLPKNAKTNLDPFIEGMIKKSFPYNHENFLPDKPKFNYLKSAFKRQLGIDGALAFLVGYGEVLSSGHSYKYIFSEAQTLLALKWKAEGYIGESLQCLRAAQYNAFETTEKGSGYFNIPPLNSLGVLTRMIYFSDFHDSEFSLTKSVLNYTLYNVYEAFMLIDRETTKRESVKTWLNSGDQDSEPTLGKTKTTNENVRLQILTQYELRSPGMCSAILTLFDLILGKHVEIIKNKQEETEWENHIKTNKVGLDFARWMLKIWTNRCSKLDMQKWYDPRIEDIIDQSKPYWIEEFIHLFQNFHWNKLCSSFSFISMIIATFLVMYWIPQEEDEEARQQEVHDRIKDKTKTRQQNKSNQAKPKTHKLSRASIVDSDVTECFGDVNNNHDSNRKRTGNGKNNNASKSVKTPAGNKSSKLSRPKRK